MDLFYTCIEKDSDYKTLSAAGRRIIEYAAKNFYYIKNAELQIINGKPLFKFSDIKFSISHTNGIAAVCFDNDDTGFDIEEIKERDYIKIAKRMKFKLDENSPECFYKHWTKYEAEFKLHKKQKSSYSFIFEKKYMVTIVSSEKKDIKSGLKTYKI